jgi:hypothetical protein
MQMTVVEAWIEGPLKRFVDDAGAELALLLHPSGQVLAQHGFAREVDVMTACALAEGRPFRGLHHSGRTRQIFLAEAQSPRGAFVFLTVFGPESSLGLVRLYFEELVNGLAAAAPPLGATTAGPALAEHFERDLNRNLAVLFGRA